jgi:uncharacterized protein YyaL (SSP411 family)
MKLINITRCPNCKISAFLSVIISLLAGLSFSCKKKSATPAILPATPRLISNDTIEGPSPLQLALANSTIHWKQYSPASMQYARESNKMVLVYASTNLQQNAAKVFAHLESDPKVVSEINDHFVPVLVDVDACRELAMISTILSAEIKRSVCFPFMMWMTAEGNPVGWLPISAEESRSAIMARIKQAQYLVITQSLENNDYIHDNSAKDAATRKERLKMSEVKPTLATERQAFFQKNLRDLNALYDDLSGSIVGVGSLLPTTMLDYYNQASHCASLSASARKRCQDCVTGTTEMLTHSAAIDFLDDGFYSTRIDSSWAVTLTDRNGLTQANAMITFAQISQTLHRADLLQIAEKAMGFQEKYFRTNESLFAATGTPTALTNDTRYWSLNELEKTLSKEELALIKLVCETSAIGNIPAESDPKRLLFRLNSLTMRHSLSEVSKKLSMTIEQATSLLVSAKSKLIEARDKKSSSKESSPQTATAMVTLRTVSAYAALFTASGKTDYREKALSTMASFQKVFASKKPMQYYHGSLYPSVTDARAGLIAAAIQTSLDLYDITLDQTWLDYANEWLTYLCEHYIVDNRLEESPPSCRLMNLPVVDYRMIFDQSTIGVMKQNCGRLAMTGRKVPDQIMQLCQLSFDTLNAASVTHTDYLLGLLYNDLSTMILVPADVSPALKDEIMLMPLRSIIRKSVPANGGKVTAIIPSQPDQVITDRDSLRRLYTP